jgi:putative transposase
MTPLTTKSGGMWFLSAYGPIAQHFRPRRHRLPAPAYRQEMAYRFQIWQEITGAAIAA